MEPIITTKFNTRGELLALWTLGNTVGMITHDFRGNQTCEIFELLLRPEGLNM